MKHYLGIDLGGTNIATGVTITAWGTAVILLLIKLAIWVFQ